MATVWKHQNSPFWTGVYRDEQNVWRKKTTKNRDRTKALAMAIEWERAASLAREGILTESISRDIVGGILERTTGQKLRYDSTRDFCAKWIRGKVAAKAEGTAIRYAATVDRFLLFLGTKADQPINSIEPRDCQSFYDWLCEEGLAPSSIVVEIKTLRTVFNFAKRLGMISTNPAEAVELPENIHQVSRRTFTPTQIELLLKESAKDVEWRTAILFGYYAGLRLGDAVTVEWDKVDFKGHLLRITTGKTKQRLEIPLHRTLESHLFELAGDSGGPITPRLAAVPVSGRSGLSKQFLAIMRKAGISEQSVDTGGQRELATLSFHSLRKTFNSALHNKGVSQELRKKLTGHKSDAMNDRYTKTELHTLRAAVRKLPSLQINDR